MSRTTKSRPRGLVAREARAAMLKMLSSVDLRGLSKIFTIC